MTLVAGRPGVGCPSSRLSIQVAAHRPVSVEQRGRGEPPPPVLARMCRVGPASWTRVGLARRPRTRGLSAADGSGGQPSAGGPLVPPMGEFNGGRNLPTRHRRKGDQWVAGPATARAGCQATVVRAPRATVAGPSKVTETRGGRLPGARRRLEQWGSGRRSDRRQRVRALAAQPMTPGPARARHWPRLRPNGPTTRIRVLNV